MTGLLLWCTLWVPVLQVYKSLVKLSPSSTKCRCSLMRDPCQGRWNAVSLRGQTDQCWKQAVCVDVNIVTLGTSMFSGRSYPLVSSLYNVLNDRKSRAVLCCSLFTPPASQDPCCSSPERQDCSAQSCWMSWLLLQHLCGDLSCAAACVDALGV